MSAEHQRRYRERHPEGVVSDRREGVDRSLLEMLTDEVRELVEGIHGRPQRKRGTTVVIASVVCKGGDPCWVAKVKFGSLVVAKCGASKPRTVFGGAKVTPPNCGHHSPEDALAGLLEQTKAALGIVPHSAPERARSLGEGEQPAPSHPEYTRGRRG